MSTPVHQTSNLAIVSLVTGILGWTLFPFLGSLAAIITGHLARKEIRNSAGTLYGDGYALTGLVLGWIAVGGIVLMLLIFVLFFGGLSWLGYANR